MSRVRLPKYRLHKGSGQAVVTLSGRDFYLGPYHSSTSRTEYDRLTAEWLAHGRRTPGHRGYAGDLSVNELLAAYWQYAQSRAASPQANSATSTWIFTTSGVSTGRLRSPSSARLP